METCEKASMKAVCRNMGSTSSSGCIHIEQVHQMVNDPANFCANNTVWSTNPACQDISHLFLLGENQPYLLEPNKTDDDRDIWTGRKLSTNESFFSGENGTMIHALCGALPNQSATSKKLTTKTFQNMCPTTTTTTTATRGDPNSVSFISTKLSSTRFSASTSATVTT